jgi:hypothetical protein
VDIYHNPFVKDEVETMFPFAREAGRIIYTNVGNVKEVDELHIKAGEEYFKAETIIESYHNGGNDEGALKGGTFF